MISASSLPAIIQDLPDTLLGDAESFSQSGYRFTFFVASTNLSIALAFGGSAIGDRGAREY
jgi:hypothetical protein